MGYKFRNIWIRYATKEVKNERLDRGIFNLKKFIEIHHFDSFQAHPNQDTGKLEIYNSPISKIDGTATSVKTVNLNAPSYQDGYKNIN